MMDLVTHDIPTSSSAVQVDRRRVALVVLGMHRTGTSALTGVLHYLGAVAPTNLQLADGNNAKGYWESWQIVQLNNRILESSGSRWNDWTAFDEGNLDPAIRAGFEDDIVKVLATEFGAAPLISLKDPRMCRLAPLWLKALDRAGFDSKFVITVRNPLESALSLRARDKISIQEGLLLWLRHVLDAERFTRGRPRCFVSFAALLEDWRATVESMSNILEISWPVDVQLIGREVDQFLRLELRHQQISRQDLALQTDAIEWVVSAYDALVKQSAAVEPLDQQLAAFDSIYTQFDRATRLFGPMASRYNAELVALGERIKVSEDELTQRANEADRHQKELATVSAALSLREAELAHSIGQARQASRDLESLRRQLVNARRGVNLVSDARLSDSWFSLAAVKRLRRRLRRYLDGDTKKPSRSELEHVKLIRSSSLFDAAWYLETYPDVHRAGIDPVLHYLRHGGSEGRDPSSRFSTTAYQQRYLDVTAAGINPLLHFLKFGIGEARHFEASRVERSITREP